MTSGSELFGVLQSVMQPLQDEGVAGAAGLATSRHPQLLNRQLEYDGIFSPLPSEKSSSDECLGSRAMQSTPKRMQKGNAECVCNLNPKMTTSKVPLGQGAEADTLSPMTISAQDLEAGSSQDFTELASGITLCSGSTPNSGTLRERKEAGSSLVPTALPVTVRVSAKKLKEIKSPKVLNAPDRSSDEAVDFERVLTTDEKQSDRSGGVNMATKHKSLFQGILMELPDASCQEVSDDSVVVSATDPSTGIASGRVQLLEQQQRAHQEFHKAPQIIVPQLLPAAEQSHRCPIAGEAILQGKQHATTNPVQQQLGSALVLLDQASESLTQRTCEPHSGTTTLNTKLDSNKEVHKPLLSREYRKGKHLPRTCNTVAEDSQKSVVHTSSVDVGTQAERDGYEKPHERDSVNKVPKSTTSARDTRASRPDPDVMSRLRRLEEMQHLNTVDKLKLYSKFMDKEDDTQRTLQVIRTTENSTQTGRIHPPAVDSMESKREPPLASQHTQAENRDLNPDSRLKITPTVPIEAKQNMTEQLMILSRAAKVLSDVQHAREALETECALQTRGKHNPNFMPPGTNNVCSKVAGFISEFDEDKTQSKSVVSKAQKAKTENKVETKTRKEKFDNKHKSGKRKPVKGNAPAVSSANNPDPTTLPYRDLKAVKANSKRVIPTLPLLHANTMHVSFQLPTKRYLHKQPVAATTLHTEPSCATVVHTEPSHASGLHTEPSHASGLHTEPSCASGLQIEPLHATAIHAEPSCPTAQHTEPSEQNTVMEGPLSCCASTCFPSQFPPAHLAVIPPATPSAVLGPQVALSHEENASHASLGVDARQVKAAQVAGRSANVGYYKLGLVEADLPVQKRRLVVQTLPSVDISSEPSEPSIEDDATLSLKPSQLCSQEEDPPTLSTHEKLECIGVPLTKSMQQLCILGGQRSEPSYTPPHSSDDTSTTLVIPTPPPSPSPSPPPPDPTDHPPLSTPSPTPPPHSPSTQSLDEDQIHSLDTPQATEDEFETNTGPPHSDECTSSLPLTTNTPSPAPPGTSTLHTPRATPPPEPLSLSSPPQSTTCTKEEAENTASVAVVTSRELSLSESSSYSSTTQPQSHSTSSTTCTTDRDISAGEYISRRPVLCPANVSLSEGEVALSPGDVQWQSLIARELQDLPHTRNKNATSVAAKKAFLHLKSMDPSMSELSSSDGISIKNEFSEGEFKGWKREDFSPHHIEKFLSKLSTSTPDDTASQTTSFAIDGNTLSEISDSLLEEPHVHNGSVAAAISPREKLPFALSPGEIRPSIAARDQIAHSKGAVPHKTMLHRSHKRKPKALDPISSLTQSSHSPGEIQRFNRQRNGIDVIDISHLKPQHSKRLPSNKKKVTISDHGPSLPVKVKSRPTIEKESVVPDVDDATVQKETASLPAVSRPITVTVPTADLTSSSGTDTNLCSSVEF